MSDIVATDTFQRLYNVAYHKVMWLGLFSELNEEKLFEREEWTHPTREMPSSKC